MIKVNAISLDQTMYFNIRNEDKKHIKAIRAVYAYNPESSTNLCELTPSYELRYLHTYIVLTDDVSDTLREELDERYCHEPNDDIYIHCADLRQASKDRKEYHKECGEFDSMDEACEHLNGNWPF